MKHIVFVIPHLGRTGHLFFGPLFDLEQCKISVISHEPIDSFPRIYQQKICGHYRVNNALDPGQLVVACRFLQEHYGPVHRLFGFLEDLQIALGIVREHLNIEGMHEAVTRNFREKARMKELFQQNDIPCAQHCLATDTDQAVTFAQSVGFPVVVKPPAGAGARNTFQINNTQQLQDYLSVTQPSPEHPILFEEFIQGDEFSCESISIHGNVVWSSVTCYSPTPLEVLKNPWIQWCILFPRELEDSHYQQAIQLNHKVLSVLGMQTGLSHMEWFLRKDGRLTVSEVAARPPGAQIITLTSLGYDFDMHRAWGRLMALDRFDPPTRKYASGVAFLRGLGSGKVKAIHGLTQAQREVGSLVVEAKLPQIGQSSSPSYEGEGYVVLKHPRTEVVKEALRRLVSTIRIEFANED
ncbi:MAG: ATP-grasp domain-containing protein [Myxococcota bacterium]